MKPELEGTWLVPGEIDGEIVCLDEPLSFWGGFDPITGRIIDRSHPQHGLCLAGLTVGMSGSKGSSGTPGVLGESIRRGTGPRAIVVTKADINLVAGSLTAEALYGRRCPILLISQNCFDDLKEQTHET
jgi:predicted aconitase with swiveling domain